jgi:cysteine desulfurase
VARSIGAQAEEVFFTSGGTEANNLALLGAARVRSRGHLVASAIEHSSVLEALSSLEAEGYETSLVPVSELGLLEPGAVLSALRPETVLVSLMQANNEVGSLLPVAEVGRRLKETRPDVLFHIDAVQAAGKLPIDVAALHCDLLTLSAHKVHGPKGVGSLYVRQGVRLLPLLRGGLRERGLRPGTENVAGIVGFGVALALADGGEGEHLGALRDRLLAGLETVPGLAVNGPLAAGLRAQAAPHVLSVSVSGIPAPSLVAALSEAKVFVSMRSACAGNPGQSHVLAAMGLPKERRQSAVRLCVSRLNTPEEMDAAADTFASVVEELLLGAAPT